MSRPKKFSDETKSARYKVYKKNYHSRLKIECFRKYGGKCECCGELRPQFLSIDHSNGDGGYHRKEVAKARTVFRWLKVNDYPEDGFRVLCFNCNLGKGLVGFCHPELAQEA